MQRTPPSNNLSAKNYINGSPRDGISPSYVPPSVIDDLVSEIMYVITEAGAIPNATTTQLHYAITNIVANNPTLKYIANNIADLAAASGGTININDTTQLRQLMLKLLTTSYAFSTTERAGSVRLSKEFTINESGIITNNFKSLSNMTNTGLWTIKNLSVNKPLFIVHRGTSKTDSLSEFTITSGSAIPSPCAYVIGAGHSNSVTVPLSSSEVTVSVTMNINGILYAYQ
jgi:hypothetical protein